MQYPKPISWSVTAFPTKVMSFWNSSSPLLVLHFPEIENSLRTRAEPHWVLWPLYFAALLGHNSHSVSGWISLYIHTHALLVGRDNKRSVERGVAFSVCGMWVPLCELLYFADKNRLLLVTFFSPVWLLGHLPAFGGHLSLSLSLSLSLCSGPVSLRVPSVGSLGYPLLLRIACSFLQHFLHTYTHTPCPSLKFLKSFWFGNVCM